jgi:hypothetical protein
LFTCAILGSLEADKQAINIIANDLDEKLSEAFN